MGPSEPQTLAATEVAFRAFYEAEVVRQVRAATLILGSVAAAQDAVHDAFVAVWQRWGSIAEPGPYLQRAVLNRCRDLQRRARVADRRLAVLAARPDVSGADVPAVDLALYDALARLPFRHRAAVVLRFYVGLPEAEIAARLGCRPGSVGPWIRRGLDRLAGELHLDEGGPR